MEGVLCNFLKVAEPDSFFCFVTSAPISGRDITVASPGNPWPCTLHAVKCKGMKTSFLCQIRWMLWEYLRHLWSLSSENVCCQLWGKSYCFLLVLTYEDKLCNHSRLKWDLLQCYLILSFVLQSSHLFSVLWGMVGPTMQLHISTDMWNALCHVIFYPVRLLILLFVPGRKWL